MIGVYYYSTTLILISLIDRFDVSLMPQAGLTHLRKEGFELRYTPKHYG
jgi:hypothetical protein